MTDATWRKALQAGSFRGVAFSIDAHETAGGRRTVQHEYPLRDEPYAEDLGRKAREFGIECLVIGEDYMPDRDALVEALEQEGPGTLVHPYLGSRLVVVQGYRLRESSAEGGIARFSITFLEAGRIAEPDTIADTPSAVDTAADAASAATVAEFGETFSVAGAASYVADAAVGIVQDANSALRNLSGRIAAATSPITAFAAQLDQLGQSVGTLIRTPLTLAADVAGVVYSLAGVASSVAGAFAAYREFGDFGKDAPAPPSGTASRAQQTTNQTALYALLQRSATIEAVRSSARLTFATSAEALAARDALRDSIDTLMDTAGSGVYVALLELRAAMVSDLTTRGGSLPRVVPYTAPATTPALVLAYRTHSDAQRDTEIVARNRVRHPGFVPGGVALEVLTDA